ncbi:NAT4 (YMR069W) [Zygosaccharomyces parabailii]|nr:NAT4 (YMR069W) [Zygosaccharomyces parabailii]
MDFTQPQSSVQLQTVVSQAFPPLLRNNLTRRIVVGRGQDNSKDEDEPDAGDEDKDEAEFEHKDKQGEQNKGKNDEQNIFRQQLRLVDENLGTTYSSKSKKLYGNNKPWQQNKMQEMATPGLIHVSYWQDDLLRFFVSFMPTVEEISPGHQATVLYLYELQIADPFQRKGLGHQLFTRLLRVCKSLHLAGIELTVFSDNVPAIAFYRKIGMKLAHDSPRDSDATSLSGNRPAHRTRSRSRTPEILATKTPPKPDYYILFQRV